jgi:hypothetical protein
MSRAWVAARAAAMLARTLAADAAVQNTAAVRSGRPAPAARSCGSMMLRPQANLKVRSHSEGAQANLKVRYHSERSQANLKVRYHSERLRTNLTVRCYIFGLSFFSCTTITSTGVVPGLTSACCVPALSASSHIALPASSL